MPCGVPNQRVKMKRVDPAVGPPTLPTAMPSFVFFASTFLSFFEVISTFLLLNGRRDGSSSVGSVIWGRLSRNCA